jgi:hypothetical protein
VRRTARVVVIVGCLAGTNASTGASASVRQRLARRILVLAKAIGDQTELICC